MRSFGKLVELRYKWYRPSFSSTIGAGNNAEVDLNDYDGNDNLEEVFKDSDENDNLQEVFTDDDPLCI